MRLYMSDRSIHRRARAVGAVFALILWTSPMWAENVDPAAVAPRAQREVTINEKHVSLTADIRATDGIREITGTKMHWRGKIGENVMLLAATKHADGLYNGELDRQAIIWGYVISPSDPLVLYIDTALGFKLTNSEAKAANDRLVRIAFQYVSTTYSPSREWRMANVGWIHTEPDGVEKLYGSGGYLSVP